jgi:amino acid transporter
MKELEIKKIDVFSAFKVTIYLMVIPVLLFFLIGIVMTLAGLFTRTNELLFVGIIYTIMSIFIVIIYAVLSMLVALIYNWLSGKFGGLKITVSEKLIEDNLPINNSELNKE